MHVTRLRLSGFKSFVDPTEFPIDAGLTGVIGPNGCGKSNLLEALRWVMGAASAKAMRADGMDDVIFAGAAGRGARSHAEVTLTLDNSQGDGPAAFAAMNVLEVTRRIDRGQGSSYRINGLEARARDVQLLFADASTGANSPALVRQGQISELIAARPQNRRRILEEAAGVSGLHGRRHEALLRLKGAQANLARLNDLAREVEASQSRLRREARTAERFRTLSGEIRKVENALGLARWSEAAQARDQAQGVSRTTDAKALQTARDAARASAALLRADERLPALRQEATAAAAVRARLALEMDRAERDLDQARTEAARLAGEIQRIRDDLAREGRMGTDSGESLTRVTADLARIERQVAQAPERTPLLETQARAAEAQRVQADAALEALAAHLAAAQAERRAAGAQVEAVRERLARAQKDRVQTQDERAAMGALAEPGLAQARAAAQRAAEAESLARADLDRVETKRAEFARAEGRTRAAMRAGTDELARLEAAARGLTDIAQISGDLRFPPVLEEISVVPGLEAALAAALGDDLGASLDPQAPSFWAGRDRLTIDWPEGAVPLRPSIRAPDALDARLAFVGLTDRDLGPRLQGRLPPGARLVSRQGDLWRWDGLTVSAEAPRPAQVRLEQKNRLADLRAQAAKAQALADETQRAHADASARLAQAEEEVRAARALPPAAASEAARAREALTARERSAALREARAQGLDQTLARLEAEQREAEGALAVAVAALGVLPADDHLQRDLTAARSVAGVAREAAFAARAALDRERGAHVARVQRLEGLRREAGEWRGRAETAQAREVELLKALEAARHALDAAHEAPIRLETRHQDLADQARNAQTREATAARCLGEAEAERHEAERAGRAADALAADAREARAAAQAHLEAAMERVEQLAAAIWDATGLSPADLAQRIGADAVAIPPLAGGVEAHLSALKADLTAMGQVNLRAEEDLAEVNARLESLAAERADLDGALTRLGQAIAELEAQGRERLVAAFEVIDGHFRALFSTLFQGGVAELRLVDSADPLESGLEIFACPPGKRLAAMSLMSGGEQALTAVALIFAVFLANPAPICVLDEVDAPLDDANVERFCNLLDEMRRRAPTRFLTITHNPLTMSRMDRLFGVTMRERGVSQLVSVDLSEARHLKPGD